MKTEITCGQMEAIRFYMGDSEIVKQGIYRGGAKAYNTINALLHYGTQDEIEKIRDGKPIEIYDREHLESYLRLIAEIRNAMEVYREQHCCDEKIYQTTYRIDRLSAVERFQNDRKIYGYFSTCKWGFLPEYARTKSDIVLLEVHRSRKVPYLDFAELFQDRYAKPEEAEILLPYGAEITNFKEIPLTQEECTVYTDMNGRQPRGKWRLEVSCGSQTVYTEEEKAEAYRFCVDSVRVREMIRCMKLLSENKKLSEADEYLYSEWKCTLMKAVG